MRANLWFLLIVASVLLLALTDPSPLAPPGRDPVPDVQKVAHSSHCAGCHGPDPEGQAMTDALGNDVSIQDDWQISMMGLSAYDPFWRATVAHETHAYPSQQAHIESVCLSCHSPLGHFQAGLDGRPYGYADMLGDSLGLDGVSCSACHQQPETGLGNSFSGTYTLDTTRVLYGPYPNPFRGPMQIYVRFEPVYSEHISTSALCAGCHTLITETLFPDGQPTGSFFVEQATYHEWLNSAYAGTEQTCQSCHMPRIEEPVVIASGLLALEGRSPYAIHQFQGANTAMLNLMRDNRESLALPAPADSSVWDESIANNRASLGRAAWLSLSDPVVSDDTLAIDVTITNRTGHKLPSGYPSRLLWVEVLLTTSDGTDTLYLNGALDEEGEIAGRDLPFEPHHEVIRAPGDVQIYELAMGDLEAKLTTRLNAAYRPLKDNRLLPAGFRTTHAAYDTVAVWGKALTDEDYAAGSEAGRDRLRYRIGLRGRTGLADLQVRLHYQTLPPRWMRDLFTADSLEAVAGFKGMYSGYDRFRETVAEARVDNILLDPSSSEDGSSFAFRVYPNPASNELILELPSGIPASDLRVNLYSLQGELVLQAQAGRSLSLPQNLPAGVYVLQLREGLRLVTSRRITLL